MVVFSLLAQQFLMIALLHDLALGQQDDVVRVLDGGKPVGHNQHGTDVLHFFQRILNQQLRFRVDVGGGFVQNHDGGLVDDGTGKA